MKLWSLTLERVAALEAQLNAKYDLLSITLFMIFLTGSGTKRWRCSRPRRLQICGTRTSTPSSPAGTSLSRPWRNSTTLSPLVRLFDFLVHVVCSSSSGKNGKGKKVPLIKRLPVKKPASTKPGSAVSAIDRIMGLADGTRGVKRKQPLKSKPPAKMVRIANERALF